MRTSGAAPLEPVAELRTRRHGSLVTRDRITAEVTVDEVTVMDAQNVAAEFVELEIELRDGDPSALGRIAKELERAGAKASAQTPKLFRVLALEPRPRAKTPFEMLRRLLHEQLDQLFAHDPGTRLGTDPRACTTCGSPSVAPRALLRAGKPLIATDTEELSLELQWLGSVLGGVRDLDVLLARLRAEAATLDAGDRAAAGRLLRALERQRTRARRTLLKALDGQRYDILLDRFEALVTSLAADREQDHAREDRPTRARPAEPRRADARCRAGRR